MTDQAEREIMDAASEQWFSDLAKHPNAYDRHPGPRAGFEAGWQARAALDGGAVSGDVPALVIAKLINRHAFGPENAQHDLLHYRDADGVELTPGEIAEIERLLMIARSILTALRIQQPAPREKRYLAEDGRTEIRKDA